MSSPPNLLDRHGKYTSVLRSDFSVAHFSLISFGRGSTSLRLDLSVATVTDRRKTLQRVSDPRISHQYCTRAPIANSTLSPPTYLHSHRCRRRQAPHRLNERHYQYHCVDRNSRLSSALEQMIPIYWTSKGTISIERAI